MRYCIDTSEPIPRVRSGATKRLALSCNSRRVNQKAHYTGERAT